jgi:hypothetical protein
MTVCQTRQEVYGSFPLADEYTGIFCHGVSA